MEKIEDDRFTHMVTDPRFRKTPKLVKKVKIDKRFQSLFSDKRFQVKYNVDKRGRPVNQSSHENFKKYYEVSSDEDDINEEDKDRYEGTEVKSVSVIPLQSSIESKDKLKINSKDKTTKTSKVSKANMWVVTPNERDEKSNQNSKMSNTCIQVKENRNKDGSTMSSKNMRVDLDSKNQIEKARLTDEIKMKLRDSNIDYARGVGALISDSSSDEESSFDSESEDELVVEHGWGELDRDADTTEEPTDRLAVLHMDWDRIRAVDLMVLLNSFLPPDGIINSVSIYPSQFGLERMKEEENKGPIELTNIKVKEDLYLNEESKEGKQYHMERLRQYQLNRLKYYYAIVKFDRAETANKVYTECDGLEYESSATKLDLRFVPQEEIFDQDPREVCTEMPDPAKFEPRVFTNTALQQGKVELTWDETDLSRQEFTKKIKKNADKINNEDLQAYLAYSSDDAEVLQERKTTLCDSESDVENVKEEDSIARYKSLLASLEEEEEKKKNKDVDLEITWGVGLKEKAEKSIKEKLNTPQTPFEEIIEKRKQKKKVRKEEKINQRKKEQKNSSEESLSSDDNIPSDVDINDPYFKEELQGLKLKKTNKTIVHHEQSDKETKGKEAELELLLLEENDAAKQKRHFNIKIIQENESKKKKRRKQLKKRNKELLPQIEDTFQVDIADDRFSALFTSHHFNIDPADPQFRKTKAMDTIIAEKLKRRQQEHELQPVKLARTDPELSLLVKSIKNKTKHKL